MNDLPAPPLVGNLPINQSTSNPINQSTSGGSGNKEVEVVTGGRVELPLKDVTAVEIELPQEVAQAGVKVQPTQVQLPQNVMQAGVQTVGGSSVTQAQTVSLPLTDEEIAKGLKASVTSSLRWLTEWCLRRMKQLLSTNHKSQ